MTAKDQVSSPSGKVTLHALIRGHYQAMPPAERVLADTLLNFPGELATYSATELARISEVSNSAVTRFVRRLGFSGYDEMRRAARHELENGAPLYLFGKTSSDAPEGLVERHVDTVVANLRATFTAETRELIDSLASAVAVAGQVWIAGFRHGRPLAEYLRWSLLHARARVHLFPGPGETIGESIVDLGAKDVLIVFALRRRVPAIATIIEFALRNGTQVAMVTDTSMIHTEDTRWLLRRQTRTKGPIDDHAPPLLFAHMLTEQTMLKLKKDSRRRLADIDELHSFFDELE